MSETLGQPESPFRSRTAWILVAVAGLSFIGAIILSMLSSGAPSEVSFRQHPRSISAVGYQAFLTSLEAEGVPTYVTSRGSFLEGLGGTSLSVVAEPTAFSVEGALDPLFSLGPALVILPKWRVRASEDNAQWIGEAELQKETMVDAVLSRITDGGAISRPGSLSGWRSPDTVGAPSLGAPQVIIGSDMEPIVETAQGILLGRTERGRQTVYVLSDPDVLNNHGLDNVPNYTVAMGMFDLMRDGNGAVVFDGTLYGYGQQPSRWGRLLAPPIGPVALLAFAAMLIFAWAALPRLGKPRKVEAGLDAGKLGLVRHTARLLSQDGASPQVVADYGALKLREVSRALQVPGSLSADERLDWLARFAAHRGVALDIHDLQHRTEALRDEGDVLPEHLMRLVQSWTQWAEEMTRGPE